MKLTDEQLNEKMALILGWQIEDWPKTIKPDGIKTFGLPDFCNDRNALPEIWSAIEKAELQQIFRHNIIDMLPRTMMELWDCHISCPRLQVIAALKALDKWPDDWQEQFPTP